MCFGGSGAPEQKPGPYELKLAELGNKRLDNYEETYKPLEQDLIDESAKYDQEWYKDQQANIAASAARGLAGFNAQTDSASLLKKQLMDSTRLNQTSAAQGGGSGGSVAAQQGVAHKMNMAQAGRQQAMIATGLYGSLAANEVGQNIAKQNAETAMNNATMGAVGGVVGAGAGYWLGRNRQGQGINFKNQMRKKNVWGVNTHTPSLNQYNV